MNKKININIIAHDGVTSHYTGVGRVIQDSLAVLADGQLLPFNYQVNALTGKYNKKCLGFNPELMQLSIDRLSLTGGKLYECINGSLGEISYGNIDHWQVASVSAATTLKRMGELNRSSFNVNLCIDTPYAQVANYFTQYDDYRGAFVWIPHSTAKIHKIDSAIKTRENYLQKRTEWEIKSVELANCNRSVFVGYISQYMKKHLLSEYGADSATLVDFTNGLNLEDNRFRSGNMSQGKIRRILVKHGISVEKPLLISFGRLEPYKGFEFTIKLGGLMAKKGLQTVLIAKPYTKNDPLVGEYKKLMKKFNPGGMFLYDYSFESLPHAVMQWKNTKILLLPSLAEPFGLIPEEARLYNRRDLAVVTSNKGGLAEQIKDRKDGFLLDIDDLDGSYKKLAQIGSLARGTLAKMSRLGYQRVLQNYDLRRNLKRSILNLLEKCEIE